MPGTYSQISVHAVFSTKQCKPWITDAIAEDLYPYIGGIIRDAKGTLYEIGGVADVSLLRAHGVDFDERYVFD